MPQQLSTGYVPDLRKDIYYLTVPENRAALAFRWFERQPFDPFNFSAFAYWLERCQFNEGADY